jgi:hypothetical protein
MQAPLSASHEGGYSAYPPQAGAGGYGQLGQASPSVEQFGGYNELGRPNAPFMAGGEPGSPGGHSRRDSYTSQVYAGSAAGAMNSSPMLGGHGDLPRTASMGTFRAPFLSPASRPGSSMWAPPQFGYANGSSAGSVTGLAVGGLKHRAPMPSSRLAAKLTADEKPWIRQKDGAGRLSWWITMFMMIVGVGVGALTIYLMYADILLFKDPVCLKLDENFSEGLDSTRWNLTDERGDALGTGEFEIMRSSSNTNLFVQNGQLHLHPSLVSDEMPNGFADILDGGSYTLSPCSLPGNDTACKFESQQSSGTVIPPVFSARLSTQGSVSIRFGRVEVKAKLPRGDWLWPAIWMLPVNNTYGAWPLSGEIDVRWSRLITHVGVLTRAADHGGAREHARVPERREQRRAQHAQLRRAALAPALALRLAAVQADVARGRLPHVRARVGPRVHALLHRHPPPSHVHARQPQEQHVRQGQLPRDREQRLGAAGRRREHLGDGQQRAEHGAVRPGYVFCRARVCVRADAAPQTST